MQNLFNYSTLSTRLEKSTRTLFITLNKPEWQNALRLEMLFEIESLLAWCTSRVEINSIIIESSAAYFSSGLDIESLSSTSVEQLEKIHQKLQKIILAMMQLPQTIIVDLGDGSQTIASEFSLGADIRIASDQTQIAFNHSQYGLVPACGGMSLLNSLVSPAYAKNWILTGDAITHEALIHSGLIRTLYTKENRIQVITDILHSLSEAAPIQRIQSKLGLFETLRSQIEQGFAMDRKITKASMMSQDWRSKRPEQKECNFMPAKSLSYAVKLSLIKTEEVNRTLDH